MGFLERHFELEARGTTVVTELRAGVVTFLTLSYILFVNPQVLAGAGMPAEDVAVATALAAAVATFVMGIWANLPFALAPGMGLNAYFTYGVVHGLGVSWQVALTAVFVEGLLFLLLAVSGARSALMRAIPGSIKIATMSGIGLFLAIIGFPELRPGGRPSGDPGDPRRSRRSEDAGGSLAALVAIDGAAGGAVRGSDPVRDPRRHRWSAGWAGLTPAPDAAVHHAGVAGQETFLALDFSQILSAKVLMAVMALLFVDIFDTAGTLIGVSRLAGFLDEKGDLPQARQAFTADAVGTTVGALVGHQHRDLLHRVGDRGRGGRAEAA